MDCFLVLRGIKTLALRMERHSDNGLAVARFLCRAPGRRTRALPRPARRPRLPGRRAPDERPGQPLFGGMVSFLLKGGESAARRTANTTRIFTLAESLGGVESLIEHPGVMTHASVSGSPLEVPASLVRLSVGIENIDDLLEDLASAIT